MRITRGADVERDTSPDPNFSGPAERRAFGPAKSLPAPLSTFVVTFRNGSRTRWHRHAEGQLLYILDGSGLVASRGESPVPVGPGDVVETAPGEEHWHGAVSGGELSHVALSFGETEWGESST
ncbi:MAG TPA: cupin domain-containing protein [Candidatus Limnocylindrales bacterium]|nr:cupin domain-containing protein [Candidatus Limnocylindrales bacterium]